MRLRLLLAIGIISLLGCPRTEAETSDGSISRVYKRVEGSVLVVRTTERLVVPEQAGKVSVAGVGSGVLISADGKVMTAAHVVQAADAVGVEFPDGTLLRARVVASAPSADVALLQIERVPDGVVPAMLGNSDNAEVGDQVFVVGAPLGISHTLTVGHLSARRELNSTVGGMATTELFQTDAAINKGNSGGPMFNMDGLVIGIVSHIASSTGGSEGLGFVVTSNMARRVLLDEPSVWSGLEGFLLTGEIADAFNLPEAGLLVQRVAKGSPAEKIGLRGGSLPAVIADEELILGGDVILSVEGISMGAPDGYEAIRKRLIELRTAQAAVHVVVLRAGRRLELVSATPP